jgi:spore coat protein A
MAPAEKVYSSTVAGCTPFDFYELAMRSFTDQLHPNLPPTTLFGYGNKTGNSFRHLGGAIIANQGRAVRVRFHNELPQTHILPVDMTVPGLLADAAGAPNRAAVHLHGGHVPWTSDGGPHNWFTGSTAKPDASGISFEQWLPDLDGTMTGDYWYPNTESARLMWFHDHAMGNTRLNAYAGLASGYIVRDSIEAGLIAKGGIPEREIPLVFQDKVFKPDGQLWYPDFYDQQFFALAPGGLPLPSPSLVPEFWGDTMLVNGTVAPFVDVEPRKYRLRLLNACNTRVLALTVVTAQGTTFPDNAEPDRQKKHPVVQNLIGTEGGFLDGAVAPKGVVMREIVLAPAERADVVIDFTGATPGSYYILHNDAPVPFPGGTPLADFHPRNPKLAVQPLPGYTPNTRTLLQFRVKPLAGTPDAAPDPMWALPTMARLAPSGATQSLPVLVRELTLNEAIDQYGRLSQLLGAVAVVPNRPNAMFGLEYMDPATEVVTAGQTEVWRISNLTADTHPIHFHLANVQILSRQGINAKQFNGIPGFNGKARGPNPDEVGWKETVKMHPEEATTVIMKFDLPPAPVVPVNNVPTTVTVPFSRRTPGSYEYVWHCHILEHEEHDMMRPMLVNLPV